MPRSSWLLVLLAGVALAATGCAQCDTCDELPLPCPSGDCGLGPVVAPVSVGPVMMAPPAAPASSAPVVIRSQPAGSGSGARSSGSQGSSSSSPVPAPLPPKPGVQAPPFSSGAPSSR